jgi:hypothetical protein
MPAGSRRQTPGSATNVSDEAGPGDGMDDRDVGDDAGGMPAEFVDLPENEPGDRDDPPPESPVRR